MENLSNYEKDIRPWGEYERFTLNEPTTVKIITVIAGESFSLQTHEDRSEFWRIISGNGTVIIGSESHHAGPGDQFFVQTHTEHRATAGDENLVFLEIGFGVFDEEDITRIEDKYGRA